MLRAVIFDFDGVITDSEILHFRSFNQVLAGYGVEFTIKDYYKNYLGLSDFDLFTLLADTDQVQLNDMTIEELTKQKSVIFEELAKTEGSIIEGVRDFIDMLRQNKIAIAICSGALLPEIKLTLEDAKLHSFFEVIVSAEQVKKGKPFPEGFLLALSRLNQRETEAISANQCVVIEDSRWGLEAAKAAKMHTVAITNSYEAEQLTVAEKIIDHLDHLTIDELQKLCR